MSARARPAALGLAIAAALAAAAAVPAPAQDVRPRDVTARGPLLAEEAHDIALFEKAAPSVASIFTARIPVGAPFAAESLQPVGAGSGFVWDARGHIVTNHHVVQGADAVAVTLDLGEPIAAKVVGRAPDYDLAVLRLATVPRNLRALPIGRSADLKVGQKVYAIGNPFGLERTLTTGITSATERRLPTARGREIPGVIQTDAAINPGNSGGPLLDSAGRLIGVNTAILSGSGASAGVGFAVPVDIVNRVVPQLIAKGRVPTPGIGILAVPDEVAAQFDVAGVIVYRVQPGSAAANAGLRGVDERTGRPGDIITGINGKPIRTFHELAQALFELGVGATATLEVVRQGRKRAVEVEVGDIS